MQILVNSNESVSSSESASGRVESMIADALERYADRITRVEVHLSDENAEKGGQRDKRCMIEARLGGLKPIAVTHTAATMPLAIAGATEKLERALESTLGKLEKRH